LPYGSCHAGRKRQPHFRHRRKVELRSAIKPVRKDKQIAARGEESGKQSKTRKGAARSRGMFWSADNKGFDDINHKWKESCSQLSKRNGKKAGLSTPEKNVVFPSLLRGPSWEETASRRCASLEGKPGGEGGQARAFQARREVSPIDVFKKPTGYEKRSPAGRTFLAVR